MRFHSAAKVFSRWRPLRGVFVIGFFAVASSGVIASEQFRPRASAYDSASPVRRLLWVTRWDFHTEKDIEQIFYNAASARYTDVLFQVRGEATVFFKSPYEPWAGELTQPKNIAAATGTDPGWDPLAVAVREARRRGVRIHAWVNTMPVWNQKTLPPANSGHITRTHPEWMMVDLNGRRMRAGKFYASMDPALPQVRQHIAGMLAQMVKDYAVDGVHLDYVRYPLEAETGAEFSYRPEVVAQFQREFGKRPSPGLPEWQAYRRRAITTLVREIRFALLRARDGVELSAAVLADRMKSHDLAGQTPHLWLEQNYIDAVAPMAYVRGDMEQFRTWLAPYLRGGKRGKLWVGIWPRDLNRNYVEQINYSIRSGAGAVAMFSYAELFPNHKSSSVARNTYAALLGKSASVNVRPPSDVSARPESSVQLKRASPNTKRRVN